MLFQYTARQVQQAIEQVNEYYHDPSRQSFSGAHKIEEFSQEEIAQFNAELNLPALVGCAPELVLNTLLGQKEKINFALYILRSRSFLFEVNSPLDGNSNFRLLLEHLLNEGSAFQLDLIGHLYGKGYRSTPEDGQFLKSSYSSLKDQEKLALWCFARAAYILDDAVLLSSIQSNINAFFTIVSFKLKKPVGIGYSNLLGIANNAFLHYRDHGDIMLNAMKKFGAYDEVVDRDFKKSFRYRLDDFEKYKPLQNQEFAEAVKLVFKEIA